MQGLIASTQEMSTFVDCSVRGDWVGQMAAIGLRWWTADGGDVQTPSQKSCLGAAGVCKPNEVRTTPSNSGIGGALPSGGGALGAFVKPLPHGNTGAWRFVGCRCDRCEPVSKTLFFVTCNQSSAISWRVTVTDWKVKPGYGVFSP